MNRTIISLGLLLAFPLLPGAQAQNESDEHAMLEIHDGVTISKDSVFLLNLRFRMQNRAGFTTISGEDPGVDVVEARVRRLRLRFDGFVLNRKVNYYIQLAFSKSDLDLEEGETAQPIRDAIVYYRPNKYTQFGFGQSKLPGNRQRVVSSGNLQMPDRSIVNARFTLDRDFGVFAYRTLPIGEQRLVFKAAITTGDGRNASPVNAGLAYTGRLEWLPLGEFKNNGDYSEGDLEREPAPKVSICGGYSTDQDAVRTGGQLGDFLYDPRTINTAIVDMLVKYRGWAWSTEFMDRSSTSDPITVSENDEIEYVYEGRGLNTQLSYCTTKRWELVGRYSYVGPGDRIADLTPRTEEALLGLNKYFKGHRIKVQLITAYRWLDGAADLDHRGNRWQTMVQVEFGI